MITATCKLNKKSKSHPIVISPAFPSKYQCLFNRPTTLGWKQTDQSRGCSIVPIILTSVDGIYLSLKVITRAQVQLMWHDIGAVSDSMKVEEIMPEHSRQPAYLPALLPPSALLESPPGHSRHVPSLTWIALSLPPALPVAKTEG